MKTNVRVTCYKSGKSEVGSDEVGSWKWEVGSGSQKLEVDKYKDFGLFNVI